MLYSQRQSLELLGLDQTTFVYWMRVIPRLQLLKGRGCNFSESDLVALAILKLATQRLGVPIGNLSPNVDQLFDLVGKLSFPQNDRKAIIFQNGNFSVASLPTTITGDSPTVIIPLAPVIKEIRNAGVLPAELHPLERLMFASPQSSKSGNVL
jgi:hypothetical protein